MVRSLLIMALLATLFFTLKYLQPEVEPPPGKAAATREAQPPAETPAAGTNLFNPPVATPLPDVEKGYIFSEKRKIEKDDPAAAAKAAAAAEVGPDLLATVTYTGSLIIGETRRALVTYQEQSQAAPPRRPVGGRGPAPAAASAQSGTQYKQLTMGDKFLGYAVAAIEPDRLVFAKGEQKVEKFLYDRNKKRMAAAAPSRPAATPATVGGVPIEAMAPPDEQPGAAGGAPPLTGTGYGSQSDRMIRRSQRVLGGGQLPGQGSKLQGLGAQFQVPAAPVPGRPVPIIKNTDPDR